MCPEELHPDGSSLSEEPKTRNKNSIITPIKPRARNIVTTENGKIIKIKLKESILIPPFKFKPTAGGVSLF
jgi:hypothetical protein